MSDAGRDLVGRRAVVTGGGRGIGRAVAGELARRGAAVVVTARTRGQLDDVVAEIAEGGGVAHAVAADLTDPPAVAALVETARSVLGGPTDVLVNNAGVYHPGHFAETSLDDWRWVFETNVFATVTVTRAFLPDLLANDDARLIMLASIAGLKGSVGQAAYNASKHAQIGLARCLALEHGREGLRVNSVCPGFTRTDLLDLDRMAEVRGVAAESLWASIEAASSLGRTLTLEEIAALVAHLAGPGGAGVTGQSLAVDGGIVT